MAGEHEEMPAPDLRRLLEYPGIEEGLRQFGRKEVASELTADDLLTGWPRARLEELIRRYQQSQQPKP
jgi:hypothetical protein